MGYRNHAITCPSVYISCIVSSVRFDYETTHTVKKHDTNHAYHDKGLMSYDMPDNCSTTKMEIL